MRKKLRKTASEVPDNEIMGESGLQDEPQAGEKKRQRVRGKGIGGSHEG